MLGFQSLVSQKYPYAQSFATVSGLRSSCRFARPSLHPLAGFAMTCEFSTKNLRIQPEKNSTKKFANLSKNFRNLLGMPRDLIQFKIDMLSSQGQNMLCFVFRSPLIQISFFLLYLFSVIPSQENEFLFARSYQSMNSSYSNTAQAPHFSESPIRISWDSQLG